MRDCCRRPSHSRTSVFVLSGLSPDPPRRVLASRRSPLCSAARASLRHLTRVSSQSLASRGSSVSSPAAEATRGVVSCFVAFRGVVADSPSTVVLYRQVVLILESTMDK
ncbi:hypothetical protein S245_014478 [Arachis hypogaea]